LTFRGTELGIALLRHFGLLGPEHGIRPRRSPERSVEPDAANAGGEPDRAA
jgi:hypothetical protein